MKAHAFTLGLTLFSFFCLFAVTYGGFPGKPCHMAPLDVTVNQKARGCFHKNTWHMPTANLAIFYLALLLPPGQVKLCTPHGSQSIHRVAHGSHRFIVCKCRRVVPTASGVPPNVVPPASRVPPVRHLRREFFPT